MIMATQSYQFGVDTKLFLGTANVFDVTAQLRKCTVSAKENVEKTDDIPVADGTEIAGEETATLEWTIAGSLLQDLAAAGVIDWTWLNAGTEKAFMLVPSSAALRGVKGTIKRIVPLTVGGDVTKPRNRPESDFEWLIKGTPIFGVYNPGSAGNTDDTVTEDA
jgi:hypothetical protein